MVRNPGRHGVWREDIHSCSARPTGGNQERSCSPLATHGLSGMVSHWRVGASPVADCDDLDALEVQAEVPGEEQDEQNDENDRRWGEPSVPVPSIPDTTASQGNDQQHNQEDSKHGLLDLLTAFMGREPTEQARADSTAEAMPRFAAPEVVTRSGCCGRPRGRRSVSGCRPELAQRLVV